MEARKAKTDKKAKFLPPLKVVVMSATLDLESFLRFWQGADIKQISIPGRQFPVQIVYTKEPQEVSRYRRSQIFFRGRADTFVFLLSLFE
jgi:HrpA-like RNA helicase